MTIEQRLERIEEVFRAFAHAQRLEHAAYYDRSIEQELRDAMAALDQKIKAFELYGDMDGHRHSQPH